MSKILPGHPDVIAEQYATIVSFTDNGEPQVISFAHATTAIRTMIDCAAIGREYGTVQPQYLVGTDAWHLI